MPRPQFTIRALLIATALVGVGITSLRCTVLMPYHWAPWAQVGAFQACMLAAGASFGWAADLFLDHPRNCAVLGMLLFTAGGWAVVIIC